MSDSEATAQARYKVAEVCRLADVQPYVLKYWESEFPVLAAPRGATGPRLYTALELKIIERIKKLLYDEGYTIAGAKKRLEAELKEGEPPAAEPEPLVLTPPVPEPTESTGTRRRRAKAAPAPVETEAARAPEVETPPAARASEPSVPAEPVPEPPALELADAPVLSTHGSAPPPEPSIPLEVDESPARPKPGCKEIEVASSIPLEIDESPAPAGVVDDVTVPPVAAPAKAAALGRRIDPRPAPMAQSPDPRVASALVELKEIASLLSREEP